MQLSYSYQTPKNVPGGLADVAPYSILSRINGESEPDVLKFGMGAVVGGNPGKDVLTPTAASDAEQFEGIVLQSFIGQQAIEGGVKLYSKATVGILRYGYAWGRVDPAATIEYGDPVYLITTGANAGLFTNDSGDGIPVNGRFMSDTDSGVIALIELFNSPAVLFN